MEFEILLVFQYILFSFMIYRNVRTIITGLLFPEQAEIKKWEKIASIGNFKYMTKNLPHIFTFLVAIFFGYRFALFPYFWLIYFIFWLFIFLIGYPMSYLSERIYKLEIENEINRERMKRLIFRRKIFAFESFIVLIIWIVSWKHLFI